MSVKLDIIGNGKFSTKDQSSVVIGYNFDETATPTAPVDTFGEIPTITIFGDKNDVETLGTSHPASKLLLNNKVRFEDSIRGVFNGKIVSTSISTNSVSVNAQSKFEVLNSTKTSSNFDGDIAGAFAAYFELGGLTSEDYEIDPYFSDFEVVYPAWSENVWLQLKLLCATVDAEMYFQNDKIIVKPIAQKFFNLSNSSTESYKLEIGNTVKTFISKSTQTSYLSDVIIKTYAKNEDVSQVEADSQTEVILPVDFSVDSLRQPDYKVVAPERFAEYTQPAAVGTVPDAADANGFYCFLDNNGVPVPPNVATASGARLTVEKADNLFEIKIKITGPKEATNAPWTVEFARNQAALMIVGTGVLMKTSTHKSSTGSTEGNEDVDYPVNPFIVNKKYLYSSSHKSGQKLSGPNVIISLSTNEVTEAEGQEFGFLPGAIFNWKDSRYKVISAAYDYNTVNISAVQYVTFEDFNTVWDGLTFGDFNDTMFDPADNELEAMSFSDFAILPLMEPV